LIGKDEYEIAGILAREDINLVNYECQCAVCRTERASEEDKIEFNCSCGYPIKLIDDFDKYICPNCGRLVLRDRVIGSAGNYILLDIDKETK